MPSAQEIERKKCVEIAETTLQAIKEGYYEVDGTAFDVAGGLQICAEEMRLLLPDASLSAWRSSTSVDSFRATRETKIIILQISAVSGASLMATMVKSRAEKIGVLCFANAKRPGGAFLKGHQAQEESLVRSSTLFPSLNSKVAETFYSSHLHNPEGGYYSNSIIYSPNVSLIRDDDGNWIRPIEVDVLTCAAVDVSIVRQSLFALIAGKSEDVKIERVMRERMARILYCFERLGIRYVVLGSFGTGGCKNDVGMVARIWADLLGKPNSRFAKSFDRVIFAVSGKDTHEKFEASFEARTQNSTGITTQSSLGSV